MQLRFRLRTLASLFAVVAALSFAAAAVDAAPRFNAGSRSTRTFTPPPPTATAPKGAQPIERTMTTPGPATTASPAAQPARPGLFGGLFNRPGLLGGLAAGFLGAGLLGLLFGHGLFGNLGGLASFIGLLLQVGIVAIVGVMLWRWWQRRSQPALAAAGPALRDARPSYDAPRSNFFGTTGPAAARDDGPVEITSTDYNVFERLLGEIWQAYSAEDMNALRARMTPEMLSYYAEELAKNSSRGVVNQVTDVKLVNGDLSEAWREGDDEFATVAMHYAINDRVVDRASGRVIEGGPQEGVEMWTFRRARGGSWLLSAIQQTD